MKKEKKPSYKSSKWYITHGVSNVQLHINTDKYKKLELTQSGVPGAKVSHRQFITQLLEKLADHPESQRIINEIMQYS